MKITNERFKEGLDILLDYAFETDDCWLSDDNGGIPETRLVDNRSSDPEDPEHSEILIFANGQRFQVNWKELEPVEIQVEEPPADADMSNDDWSYSLYRETGEGHC